MLSKAHKHMHTQLKKISNSFHIPLLTEVKEGSKRYDFYFPSSPPCCIEVDGTNHNQEKADGYFFKTGEQLSKYKQNDMERNYKHKIGRIVLFRFSDKEFPSVSELLDIFGEDVIEILKNGADERNAHYRAIKYVEKQKEFRKKQAKIFREQTEQKYNIRIRPFQE